MEKVVFIAYLSNYGGIESLIIRMIRWLVLQSRSVIIIADKDRNQNGELVKEVVSLGASVKWVSFRKKEYDLSKVRIFFKNDNVKCITFSYPGLILADAIFYDKINVDIIFYDPHQFGLMMDYWTTRKSIKPILHLVSKVICKRLYNNHQIIFMDHLCKKRTLTDFHLQEKYDDVLLLPMEIKEFNSDLARSKTQNGPFNILTICRMEFPFKGYVFGLIDLFSALVHSGLNVSLTIIGSGSNDDKLSEKLRAVEKEVSDKIEWIAQVPYRQLLGYFEKASVYIGMGTTVVDAVNHSVTALPIGSYTYECKGYDFFSADPENLGGLHGERDIIDFVRKIYKMDADEYVEHCRKDHEELKRMYDIQIIGEKFMSFVNTKHMVFNSFERKVISFAKRFVN